MKTSDFGVCVSTEPFARRQNPPPESHRGAGAFSCSSWGRGRSNYTVNMGRQYCWPPSTSVIKSPARLRLGSTLLQFRRLLLLGQRFSASPTTGCIRRSFVHFQMPGSIRSQLFSFSMMDFFSRNPSRASSPTLNVSATCGRNILGSDRAARPINQTPSAYSSMTKAPISWDNLVFPEPPAPANVIRRASERWLPISSTSPSANEPG